MHRLNHPLLTSDSIVSFFEKHVIHGVLEPTFQGISPLLQLKKELKDLFFNPLDNAIDDVELIRVLQLDERFSIYAKLKQVLLIIFALSDEDDKILALNQLSEISEMTGIRLMHPCNLPR